MIEFREFNLAVWWQGRLSQFMEKTFPDILKNGTLVDCWKVDGWSAEVFELHGVYKLNGQYFWCSFLGPDASAMRSAQPKFEHTGWKAEVEQGNGTEVRGCAAG